MSNVTSAVTQHEAGYVLTLDCPEAPGLVHTVTGFLLEQHGDIHELKQFDDIRGGHFFLRVHFTIAGDQRDPGVTALRLAFTDLAREHAMRFELREASARRRVLVM